MSKRKLLSTNSLFVVAALFSSLALPLGAILNLSVKDSVVDDNLIQVSDSQTVGASFKQYIAGKFSNLSNDFIISQKQDSRFFVAQTNETTAVNTTFVFGDPTWQAASGDWDKDGVYGIAVFDAAKTTTYLKNTLTAGNPDLNFQYKPFPGVAASNIKFFSGDWDGDKYFDVGYYNSASSEFVLYNVQTKKEFSRFKFGVVDAAIKPIAGDWDGNGKYEVGTYNSKTGSFDLQTGARTTLNLTFGNPNWEPITGDWDLDGKTNVGVVDPTTSHVYFRNAYTTGNSDKDFVLSTNLANPNLKYFGFYNLDGLPSGSADYVTETKTIGANIGHIGVDSSLDVTKTEAALRSFTKNNMKAIVGVGTIFFDSFGSYTAGTSATLRGDWQDRWAQYKKVFDKYKDNIYAFYFDEPIVNGIKKDDFKLVTKQARKDYLTIGVMDVEASNVVLDNKIPYDYLENVTDFGTDFYYTDTNTTSGGLAQYRKVYQQFKNYVLDRKIWLITDGYIRPGDQASSITKALLEYSDLAKRDKQVVGVLSFLYPDGLVYGSTTATSARDLLKNSNNCAANQLKTNETNPFGNCLSRFYSSFVKEFSIK